MDRETSLKVWASKATLEDEPLEARLARLAAAAPAPLPVGLPQSLPAGAEQVDIAFITKTELHDLIYAATSTYLQQLSQMTKNRAHDHAARVADMAMQMTAGQDYMTRGTDPRA